MLSVICLFLMYWSPFVAVGALLRRTKRAMLFGAVAAPVLFFFLLWMFGPRVH
jgi:hypothetical protein